MIRRAAELSAADADADERISEDELIRIAAELGLPARHVRQALLELPAGPADRSFLGRALGPARARGVRVVASDAELIFHRLEEYLTTREYLRPLRRQQRRGWYAPAEDPISKIVRVFSRPAGRYYMARATRVALTVEPLEPGTAHVGLEVDLTGRRREDAVGGATVGGLIGIGLGFGVGAVVAGGAGEVAGIAAGTLSFGGTIAAGVAMARAVFRRRIIDARLEIEGLLDRLERDESLDPPPAPWRRRVRGLFSRPGPHPR